jgi:hypothetical protein
MLDKPTKIYLWTEIERILFEPENKKSDLMSWFKNYHKFTLKLWEKDPEHFDKKDFRLYLNENFQVYMQIPFKLPKFSIDFSHKNSIQSFHYDNSEYFSKMDLVEVFNNGIEKAYFRRIKQVNPTRVEIEAILKSMIVHPDLHVHYYKENFRELKTDNEANYIRLGFNTNNPFMFLYHLAFQLCDYKNDYKASKKKQEEFKRIVDLVEKNLQNETKVPSGKLFGLQR